nr:tRNA (N6-threonylcarbamoyladenosine(37)-N6)-methyltransferase TrmO [candidate division Zixibacteria bacterium]
METQKIEYNPIGIIHTPFKKAGGVPIQPRRGHDIMGTVEVFPEYREALDDLDGFSHIILIYHLHLSQGFKLKVIPFLDDQLRGLFATRAPRRPNPIGLSVIRLDKIEKTTLHIRDLDIIDGTPLLDIKPYVPDFESDDKYRIGWLTGKVQRYDRADADNRFEDNE